MPFAELIFETGNKSVAYYETEEEMLSAVKAHHDRALAGQPAIADVPNVPAERVVKVEVYGDTHPDDYNKTVSAEVAEKAVKEAIKAVTDENGVLAITELAGAIRDSATPLVTEPEGPHDSMYRMESVETLTADKWESA